MRVVASALPHSAAMFASWFSSQKPRLCLLDVPSDFLSRVFLRLDSVKDVVALQSTCKTLLEIGRSRVVWEDRLHKEYGLTLEADGRCADDALQNLFRDTVQLSHCVRYWGVYTDGGCDRNWHLYWMDNLFVPNNWESYCSELGNNVNCIGVLVDGLLDRDVRAQEERNYMIHKCRIPASRIFNEPHNQGGIEEAMKRLQEWSRPELANFMTALFHDMEAGGIWGELLLHGVHQRDLASERERLREFVQRLEVTASVNSAGIVAVETEFAPRCVGTPKHRAELYDSNYTAAASNQPENLVTGVIEKVTLSRHGTFSCPVATGVVFLGHVDMSHHTSQKSITDALKGLCSSSASAAFDDLRRMQDVFSAVSQKRLPPMRQRKMCDNAVFSPLKPVLWFHFYAREELHLEEELPHDDAALGEAFSESGSEGETDDSVGSEEVLFQNVNLADLMPLEDVPDDDIDEIAHLQQHPSQDIMTMHLSRRVGGNVVMLKLIQSEDRMEEFNDHHSFPNIDVNSLILDGKKLTFPIGVRYRSKDGSCGVL